MSNQQHTPGAEDKAGSIKLTLKADSGYCSITEYRISANQYARVLEICEDGPRGKQMSAAPEFVTRTARVAHRCQTTVWVKGCGREIPAGQKYAQSKRRYGLERVEVCPECAAIAKAKGAQA